MEKTAHITFTLREADGIFAADIEITTPQQEVHRSTVYGDNADTLTSYLKVYLSSMHTLRQFLIDSAGGFDLTLAPADFDLGWNHPDAVALQIAPKTVVGTSLAATSTADTASTIQRFSRALMPLSMSVCALLLATFLIPFQPEDASRIRQFSGITLVVTSTCWLLGWLIDRFCNVVVALWRRIRSIATEKRPPSGGAQA